MNRIVSAVAALALASSFGAGAESEACAWPMFGHDPGRTFAQSPECSEVSRTNVATFLPVWAVPTADNISASPAVVDGVLYVGSWDGTFYAVDSETGEQLWTFAVDDSHEVAFGRIVSTAAVGPVDVPGEPVPVEAVIFGGGGTLYALAPGRTGPTVLAKVNVDPRDQSLRDAQAANPPQIEIESSPVIGHFADGDRVFVGMDVHNRSDVGRTGLLAFGLRPNPDGPEPYRFELLYKHDPETGLVRHSLTEGSGEGFGCGGVWSSPSLDASALGGRGIVVYGTSNCDNPDESAAAGEIGREAMIAIDATSGEELWRFQPREPNDLDDDFGSTPNMLPGGAVGIGGKDGWYYARDLETGDGVWSTRAGQSGRLNSGFSVGGFIGVPAVGRATDPISGAERDVIFGVTALPTPFATPLDAGGNPLDTSLLQDPGRLFSLHAIDAATGEILWRSPLAAPAYGHVSYANGVVFASVTFGVRLQAFDAATGLPLWIMPTFGAPSSSPVLLGDMLFTGTGTRETDLEFKAFGDRLQDLLSGPLGEHPLSRLSGIFGYRLFAP
ncbi:MAG TPA: PQQ-binding-like beta-propeller repeat protein [Actinomycetota bacterium]|nr:PQQ-binding-like beta-propeller repeat protein [Actinomycetota bacterium]